MSMRVIGAGLPRTGTSSLKAGLEQLLGGRCYHMVELQARVEEDALRWIGALQGDHGQLDGLLESWVAAVDWPASILWEPLVERHPDAVVVLSHRGSPDAWWESADATVWEAMRRSEAKAGDSDIDAMVAGFNTIMRAASGFSDDMDDAAAAKARYDEHFAQVVDTVPADRLVIWQPSDGWEPLCDRLGIAVPDEPFGHHNDRQDFRTRAGMD